MFYSFKNGLMSNCVNKKAILTSKILLIISYLNPYSCISVFLQPQLLNEVLFDIFVSPIASKPQSGRYDIPHSSFTISIS